MNGSATNDPPALRDDRESRFDDDDGGGNLIKSGSLEAFAFQPLAFQLAGAADGFRLFPGASLRGFLVGSAKLHFPEDTLALHFLLERLQGLIDVVIADNDLHGGSLSLLRT